MEKDRGQGQQFSLRRRCQTTTIIDKFFFMFIEDSRKRKSTTKIEFMDEDEEMWDEDEKVDEDGLEVTMATSNNVGGSQNRRK